MNKLSISSNPAFIGRSIIGSFLSAFAGWTMVMIIFMGIMEFHSGPADWRNTSTFFAAIGTVAGEQIFFVWLIVFLPIYMSVPLRSVLWSWPICTMGGVVVGAIAGFLSNGFSIPSDPFWQFWAAVGALSGASVCLFASLTKQHFRQDSFLR